MSDDYDANDVLDSYVSTGKCSACGKTMQVKIYAQANELQGNRCDRCFDAGFPGMYDISDR